MADQPVTREKLINADIDVDNLGKAVNEKGVVNPRYGETYPTLPSAIQMIIETGGFEPFATEAELKSTTPILPKKASYSLDTHKIWLWENGIWNDTGISTLDLAKNFTKDIVAEIKVNVSNRNGVNILNILDKNNKLVMFLDQSGQLHLTGAKKPTQEYFKDIEQVKENIDTRKYSKNLAELQDDKGSIYAIFDHNSKLKLSGLSQSVQDTLNSDNFSSKTNSYIQDSKSLLSSEVQKYIVSCLSGGGIIAPVPFSQAPHDFTPPSGLVDVKVMQGERIIIDTPYRKDDGVVHPHVLEFRNGFLGYRYILGLTPYYLTQDKYENPFIYGSNDLQSFEMIDKFPQPFAERPFVEFENQKAYNSDDFFTYDFYSGELLFCWRTSRETIAGRNELWGRRTKNGLDWSKQELIYDGAVLGGVLLSPGIIFNFTTSLYELYVVESYGGVWRLKKMTSPTLKKPKWEFNKYHNTIPNANIWHVDVRYIGNMVYFLAHDDSMTGATSTKDLYLGVLDKETDNILWSDAMLVGEHYDPYKATFTPIFDYENNSISLQVLWSSRSGGDENMWRLYSSKSNSITL